MHKKSEPEKHMLLWCSPGFGVIDIWLPIIKKLKEGGNIKIDFVFPEPSSLLLEDKDSDLFNLAEQFVDRVIYRGYSGRWFIAATLVEAKDEIKPSSFYEKMSIIVSRLITGKASRYFILKVIGKGLSIVSRYFIYSKENRGQQFLYDIRTLKDDINGIFCDITVENKFVNDNLRKDFIGIHKFSMVHGLGAMWVEPGFNCKYPVTERSDVTVYSASNLEVDGYKKCFGILENKIVHVGIPRHDSDWIEFIYNQFNNTKEKIFDSFVFIIGRPASPFNTIERKKKALKDIYDIICVKHKLKLVVKTHPKESLCGVDGNIYRDALGLENYGKTWMYSNAHPFILGKKAFFSISFYSGVVIDMLAIGKPSIEYINLEGLDSYDNSNSLRDANGEPVFQYRYTNLVLGASNKLELSGHVESILNQREVTFLSLFSRYKKYFEPFEGSSGMIANDVVSNLRKMEK